MKGPKKDVLLFHLAGQGHAVGSCHRDAEAWQLSIQVLTQGRDTQYNVADLATVVN